MNDVTLSSKYQLVVPRDVRRRLHIHPGQKVRVTALDDHRFIVDTEPPAKKLYGSMAGVWGKDSDVFLSAQRKEAARGRA